MADHTVQELSGDPIVGQLLATPRRIMLDGFQMLDSAVVIDADQIAISRAATQVSLTWYVPENTERLVIDTNYPASMDLAGSRPKASIRALQALGIEAQTVEATAGAGDQTITFDFDPVPEGGNVHIVLEVPPGVDMGGASVSFEPRVKPGEGVNAQPGKEPGSSPRVSRASLSPIFESSIIR